MSDEPSIGVVDARREPEAGMALLGPDNQVRSPRKRQVIDSFRSGARKVSHALPCPYSRTIEFAEKPTRLKRMDDDLQEKLINWGYAVCDTALRKHVDPTIAAPAGFPYPAVGV